MCICREREREICINERDSATAPTTSRTPRRTRDAHTGAQLPSSAPAQAPTSNNKHTHTHKGRQAKRRSGASHVLLEMMLMSTRSRKGWRWGEARWRGRRRDRHGGVELDGCLTSARTRTHTRTRTDMPKSSGARLLKKDRCSWPAASAYCAMRVGTERSRYRPAAWRGARGTCSAHPARYRTARD